MRSTKNQRWRGLVRRAVALPLMLGVLAASPLHGAVWQYSVRVGDSDCRAHLYVPPQCQRVRGAIIAWDNLVEKPILEDPIIREAAAAENLAIIWIAADAQGKRVFDSGFK